MTEGPKDRGRKGSAKPPGGREDALKAALRENLKRRKAQARARAGDGRDEAEDDPA